MKKYLNYFIILLFYVFAFYFFCTCIQYIVKYHALDSKILFMLLCFLLIHFFKSLKQYSLLVDYVEYKKFIFYYIETTFISLLLPFKLGEFFKMYRYGQLSKNYIIGIVTILIDKFFDCLFLIPFLLYYDFYIEKQLTMLSIIIIIFVTSIIIFFMSFKSSYMFFNKYLIKYKSDKLSVLLLNLYEKINIIYLYILNMIRGKFLSLVLCSTLSFIFELIFNFIYNNQRNSYYFWNYINSIFVGKKLYGYYYMVIFGLICFIINILLMLNQKEKVKNNENKYNI